ncbi:hypothetical protein Hdeb2414_s0619g00925361 [Helianthus debilis subsp. tardiflorus]
MSATATITTAETSCNHLPSILPLGFNHFPPLKQLQPSSMEKMMFVPQACAASNVKESVVVGVQTMHRIVEDKFHDGYGKTLHIRLSDDVISSINGWYMERGLFGLVSV